MDTFLKAIENLRLQPSDCEFPASTTIVSLSRLGIAVAIFLVARTTVAGSGSISSTSGILTLVAIGIFFVVGLVMRFKLQGNPAEHASNKYATFIFLHWLLSLIVFIVFVFPFSELYLPPLGNIMFDEIPHKLLNWDLAPTTIDITRATFIGLVSWCLIGLKTKMRLQDFKFVHAFTSLQFPIFLAIDAYLLFVLVIGI